MSDTTKDDLGPIGQAAAAAANGGRHGGKVSPQALMAESEFDRQWARFEDFAREMFDEDMKRARAKAQEYGSHDLEIMGTSMEALLPDTGQLDHQSRHSAGIEMAIAFYLMGKSSRMFGGFKKGTTPGDDSWRDASIYSMMARFVRSSGRWIG